MSTLATYRIGRDKNCEVVLGHRSVSRQHAELVVSKSGKHYLTDCNSNNGTFVGRGGKWVPIVQDFVEPGEVILIGRHQTTAAKLMASARSPVQGGVGHSPKPGGGLTGPGGGQPKKGLPSGPVKRDPGTGDIVRLDED
jgi:predicted component of type VI protein secretion system